jgi:tetratricopeptide (TPR) repeat protein
MNTLQSTNHKLFIKISWLGLAIALLLLGMRSSPAEDFTNLLTNADAAYKQHNYNQAIDYSNEAIELETNSPMGYLIRGAALRQTKQFDRAENDFDKAIALTTNNIPLSFAYQNRGFLCQQMTNYEKAVDDYSRAVQMNPAFSSAYADRASVYNMEHRYDLAVMDCNMAIMLSPDDAAAYRFKGNAYSGQQNYGRAIEAYSKAIELDTNSVWDHWTRAMAYAGKEDYAHAIADFDTFIQFQSTNADAFSSRGLCKSHIGDFGNGIADCQKAIQLDTNSVFAYNNLAWLLATAPQPKLRDGQKAVEYAKRACELSLWKNAYCLGTLAAAYAEIGDFNEAWKWESKCIELGLPEKDMEQARKELTLFEQKKPYHADK